MDLFRAIIAGRAFSLKRELINGYVVSTINSWDRGYETAIIDDNGIHPVEIYSSEREAIVGHDEWVKKLENFPVEITKLGKDWDDELIILKPMSPEIAFRILNIRLTEIIE